MGDAVGNAVLVVLMAGGLGFFGIGFVVGIGMIPVPHGRIWGRASGLSRSAFAGYFGALGLSWSAAMNILLFERDSPTLPVLVLVLALVAIAVSLIVGWIVMAFRAD